MAPKKQQAAAKKRGAVAPAQGQPPSKVTKADLVEDVPSNPTLLFIAHKVSPYIDDLIDKLSSAKPVGLAGLQPFDADAYTRNLEQHGAYECTVTVSWFKKMGFTHDDNYPTVGAIQRTCDDHFGQSGMMEHPIAVRAASPDVLPVAGEMVPLTLDTYLWAWKLAWAQSVESKSAELKKQFSKTAVSIRVRFILTRTEDEAELQKWKIPVGLQRLAENTSLVGIRKIRGIVAQRDRLQSLNQPHTANDVAVFFKSVKFTEEPLTKKVVEAFLRIHTRVSAAFDVGGVLVMMESLLGTRHILSFWTHLDLAPTCSNNALVFQL